MIQQKGKRLEVEFECSFLMKPFPCDDEVYVNVRHRHGNYILDAIDLCFVDEELKAQAMKQVKIGRMCRVYGYIPENSIYLYVQKIQYYPYKVKKNEVRHDSLWRFNYE